jgi:hypothetical protein
METFCKTAGTPGGFLQLSRKFRFALHFSHPWDRIRKKEVLLWRKNRLAALRPPHQGGCIWAMFLLF